MTIGSSRTVPCSRTPARNWHRAVAARSRESRLPSHGVRQVKPEPEIGAPTLVPVVERWRCGRRERPRVEGHSRREVRSRHALPPRNAPGWGGESVTYRINRAGWIGSTRVAGLDTCLYTGLAANVDPLTPDHLAQLAIGSASSAAGMDRRDGISLLEAQKWRGVATPLMPAYEREILGPDQCSEPCRRLGPRPSERRLLSAPAQLPNGCADEGSPFGRTRSP